jgi:hypothetical protein
LARYRYRTAVLTGRWRESRAAAVRDAVMAMQAVEDESNEDRVRWLVPGEIEAKSDPRPH